VMSKYDDEPDIASAHHGSCRLPRKYDDIPLAARRFIAMPMLMIAARYKTTITWSRADKFIRCERSKKRDLSQLQKIITFSTAKIKYAKNF